MAETFSRAHVNSAMNGPGVKVSYANCVIGFFDGTKPTSAEDSEGSANLLGLATLNGGEFEAGVSTNGLNFDAAVLGVMSKPSGDVWKLTGLAAAGSGGKTATWFRVYDNSYTTGADTTSCRWDGSIGTSSTNELQMTNPVIVEGVETSINTFSLALPMS